MQKFLLFTILTISLMSCNKKVGLDYNNQFVKMEDELLPHIQETEKLVAEYLKYEQSDSIAIAGEKMEQRVEEKIVQLTNNPIPNITGATAFRNACLQYFNYLKSLYTAHKDYGRATDDKTKDAVEARFHYLINSKETAVSNIKSAQEKFAELNGFRIAK